MLGRRAVDPAEAMHYRSDRISRVNGQFYFSTRENTLEGPFFTHDDAEREINAYINRMQRAKEIAASHPSSR